MEHLSHLMEYYKEALDELMGAQDYGKHAKHSEMTDVKNMYKSMAKQELEHEEMLEKAAERLAATDTAGHLHEVWKHLAEHLHKWRGDILHHLEDD